MNIKETKVVTTEETYNFDIDNEVIKIVKDFAYLDTAINSKRDYHQKINRRLGHRRAAMEEFGKISMSKDVSLET